MWVNPKCNGYPPNCIAHICKTFIGKPAENVQNYPRRDYYRCNRQSNKPKTWVQLATIFLGSWTYEIYYFFSVFKAYFFAISFGLFLLKWESLSYAIVGRQCLASFFKNFNRGHSYVCLEFQKKLWTWTSQQWYSYLNFGDSQSWIKIFLQKRWMWELVWGKKAKSYMLNLFLHLPSRKPDVIRMYWIMGVPYLLLNMHREIQSVGRSGQGKHEL